MTTRVGSLSIDGTPISRADLARLDAEEKLHDEQRRRAARIVAAASTDIDDCRMLLSVLGLGEDVVRQAAAVVPVTSTKRPRKHRAA